MVTWLDVVAWYRDERDVPEIAERFDAAKMTPATLDRLLRAGLMGGLTAEDWAQIGPLGVALVTAEVDRAAAAARRRAAALRSAAIADLAQATSIAEIARQLGQTRQAVSHAAHSKRLSYGWARDIAADANRLTTDGAGR